MALRPSQRAHHHAPTRADVDALPCESLDAALGETVAGALAHLDGSPRLAHAPEGAIIGLCVQATLAAPPGGPHLHELLLPMHTSWLCAHGGAVRRLGMLRALRERIPLPLGPQMALAHLLDGPVDVRTHSPTTAQWDIGQRRELWMLRGGIVCRHTLHPKGSPAHASLTGWGLLVADSPRPAHAALARHDDTASLRHALWEGFVRWASGQDDAGDRF